MRLAASAFQRPSAITLIGQKVAKASQQERAELALFPLHLAEVILLQEPGEERLSQVLRILGILPLAAHVSIERIPIGATEFLQSFLSTRFDAVGSVEHDSPVSRRKPLCAGYS